MPPDKACYTQGFKSFCGDGLSHTRVNPVKDDVVDFVNVGIFILDVIASLVGDSALVAVFLV